MKKTIQRLVMSAMAFSIFISCTGNPGISGNTPQTAPVISAQMNNQEKLIALREKIREDEALALRFESDPKAVLAAEGISVQESEQVKILALGDQVLMILDDRNLQTFHADLLSPNAEKSDLQKQLDAIRAKANSDNAFKAKLLSNTAETLKAEGLDETLADVFKVVDYQPNTSFFLVAYDDTEITRKGGPRPPKSPSPSPDPNQPPSPPPKKENKELDRLLKLVPDELKWFLAEKLGLIVRSHSGGKVNIKVVKAAAGTLVAATALSCAASFGTHKFSCDKKRGLSEDYWVEEFTIALRYEDVTVVQ